MGQVKTPLDQRVYRVMKRIWGEILNHCSTINDFFVVYYTSLLAHLSGPNACVHVPLAL